MKKRILVPLDNTPVTQYVIKLADFLGQKLEAKLFFLHARNAEIQKLVDRGELINPRNALSSIWEIFHVRAKTKSFIGLEIPIKRFLMPNRNLFLK